MTIDLLSRLRPEDVHPARLAGPHAWARWGLGPPPPVDAPLRFALPSGTSDETTRRILRAMEDRLDRVAWPPQPPLHVLVTEGGLDVTCASARTTITIAATAALPATRPAGVVTDPAGWFILDETSALADRLLACDANDVAVLGDLARWAALKGDAVARRPLSEPPIPAVVAALSRQAPEARTRLDALVHPSESSAPRRLRPHLADGLRYLGDEITSLQRTRSSPPAAITR